MALTASERKLGWLELHDVRPFELALLTQILNRRRIQEGCNSILVNYESQEIGAFTTRRFEWELLQIHRKTSYSCR